MNYSATILDTWYFNQYQAIQGRLFTSYEKVESSKFQVLSKGVQWVEQP